PTTKRITLSRSSWGASDRCQEPLAPAVRASRAQERSRVRPKPCRVRARHAPPGGPALDQRPEELALAATSRPRPEGGHFRSTGGAGRLHLPLENRLTLTI